MRRAARGLVWWVGAPLAVRVASVCAPAARHVELGWVRACEAAADRGWIRPA